MFPRTSLLRVTLSAMFVVVAACCAKQNEGCKNDQDCKGAGICNEGTCLELASAPQPDTTAAQNPPTQPVATAQPTIQPVVAQAAPPTPPPAAKPKAPAKAAACKDYYCTTPKGTMGICRSGVCTDACGPGMGFDPTDTECHKICSSNSQCSGGNKCKNRLCVPW